MEAIKLLLTKLDNRVPKSVAKKLDSLNELNQRLATAIEENKQNPSADSDVEIQEIEKYIEDFREDLTEELENLVEAKDKRDAEAKAKAKADADAKAKADADAKAKEEEELKRKKGSGIGTFGIVFGTLLLVGSLGAINYFRKNN